MRINRGIESATNASNSERGNPRPSRTTRCASPGVAMSSLLSSLTERVRFPPTADFYSRRQSMIVRSEPDDLRGGFDVA